ncbi:uncharacterized protein LOC135926017 isoform X2 [Gordionus sp. m RMFG-2023]|uniref:uncharacterized protein LOC135926017 isoform X2 n=1 Tax=Gordionus sp. m RMFG-2023 TaxID=3053472 RepID=UPI0031FC5DF6
MPVIIDYGIHLLPIAILILLPATILITYSIAVSLKHVTPTGLPYISDTVILGAILAGRNPLELPAHHKWTPGSKGYRWHVISALSEWALAFAFLLYMGSFVSEFRALEWDFPQIKIRIEYEPLLYVGTLNINQPRSEPEYSNDYQNIGGDPFLANKINHVV